jgi:hypothetical protein
MTRRPAGLLALSLISSPALAADGPWKLAADLGFVEGNSHLSGEGDAAVSYRISPEALAQAGYAHEARRFLEGPHSGGLANDDRLSAGGEYRIDGVDGHARAEATADYSPTASFLPRWSVLATPHWIFNDRSDLQLSLGYDSWLAPAGAQGIETGFWHTGIGYSTPIDFEGEKGTAGLIMTFLFTSDDFLPSGLVFVDWWPRPEVGTRLSFGGGQTHEDPLTDDSYLVFSPSVSVQVNPSLTARLEGSYITGDSRRETRLAVGVDWTP